MSKAVVDVAYWCAGIQDALNARLNGFACTLLAESFGDDPAKFPNGGIAVRAHDHKGGAVFITISRACPVGLDPAIEQIAAERVRQVEVEHFDADHDDEHVGGDLALAAAAYALVGRSNLSDAVWPFDPDWLKDAGEDRNLVKAGALIAAELGRRLRTATRRKERSEVEHS